jgi:hypothetical protein
LASAFNETKHTERTATFSDGFGFLEEAFESQSDIQVRSWVRIWRRLRIRASHPYDIDRLSELARRALPQLGERPQFIKKIILPLAKSGREAVYFEALHRWLRDHIQPTNLWAEVLIWINSVTPIDGGLINLAIGWLETNRVSKRWKDVWDLVFEKTQDSDALIKVAQKWLERADPQMEIWPQVMISVLKHKSRDGFEAELSRRWLESHSGLAETLYYDQLAQLLS